jgi:hypothetical protein
MMYRARFEDRLGKWRFRLDGFNLCGLGRPESLEGALRERGRESRNLKTAWRAKSGALSAMRFVLPRFAAIP